MKRALILLGVMAMTVPAFAGHRRYYTSAGDIITGILDNARLDKSSVTMQGSGPFLLQSDFNISNSTSQTTIASLPMTPRVYSVTIATLGTIGVDIASNTADGLRAAVLRLCGSENALACDGSISFGQGVYTFGGNASTIPAGVHVYAVNTSSTVWKIASTSVPIVVCYGRNPEMSSIEGITFSFDNIAWTVPGIAVSTGCRITNSKVVDAGSMGTAAGAAIFAADRSSNAFVQATVNNYKGTVAGAANAAPVPFRIEDSKDITYALNLKGENTATGASAFYIRRSSNVFIQDGWFQDVGGIFLKMADGNNGVYIRRNIFEIVADGDGSGVVHFNFAAAGQVSTNTYITDNIVNWRVGGSLGNPFFTSNNQNASGLVFDNNKVTSFANTTVTVLNISGTVTTKAVFRNNSVNDSGSSALTYLSDSGSGTQSTGNHNLKNGVAQ